MENIIALMQRVARTNLFARSKCQERRAAYRSDRYYSKLNKQEKY